MAAGEKLRALVKSLLAFSERERRGILWMIPIAVVVSLTVASLCRPRLESSLQVAADRNAYATQEGRDPADGKGGATPASGQPFQFDPNTIDYRGLRALGFSSKAAAGILKYRASGKIFRIKEEFAACWDVGDSVFFALEPYIVISPQFAARKTIADGFPSGVPGAWGNRSTARTKNDSLFAFDPNTSTAEDFHKLGFSLRQADAIVNRRQQLGGFRSVEEFSECYVVSPEIMERLAPYITVAAPEKKASAKVDLNVADSVALLAVSGIGSLTAGRIVAYRKRLGGFISVAQLAEVQGMTEQNYERIVQQISLGAHAIQKIDINFALPEKLSGHPYISPEMLRKIVKNRQLKGGWDTPEDMMNDGTLTAAQAARLGPYLKFTQVSNR